MRVALFVLAFGLTLRAAGTRADDPPPPSRNGRDAEAGAIKRDEKPQKVVVITPQTKDVVVSQAYGGSVRAHQDVEVRALVDGYIAEVTVDEGQAVKKGDVLFRLIPILYQARLDAELAECKYFQVELDHTRKLAAGEKPVVSQQEVALAEAKLARAQAKAKLAEVELSFTVFRAPFDGLVGRLAGQKGSLVTKGDPVTTLSDNSVAWVYFHVPEARYLEYVRRGNGKDPSRLTLPDSRIELVLADDSTFKHDAGNVVTLQNTFNNVTGTISFRADFPNPDRLLRAGQTGTVAIRRALKGATVIPQRATFEVLDRRYVYVVGKDNVAHQREIVVQHELDDIFVIKKGLEVSDRVLLDGVQRVRDGDTVDPVLRKVD